MKRSIALLALVGLVLGASSCDECKDAEDCAVGQACRAGRCSGAADGLTGVPGDGCGADYLASPEVRFENVSPSGGPITAQITIRNPGSGTAVVSESVTTEEGSTCGRFDIEQAVYPFDLPEDAERQRTVTFTPDPAAPSGCACFAVGSYRVAFDEGPGCEPGTALLAAAGPCDAPLYCSAVEIGFPGSVVDSVYTRPLTCIYLGSAGATLKDIRIAGGSGSFFSLKTEGLSKPLDLAAGDRFDFSVAYAPLAAGEDSDAVTLVLGDGETMRIPVWGSAETERPLCANGLPDSPEPELEGDNYLITLEPAALSTYPGLIRSQLFYDGEPPMISDILVTSGSFTDPECEVSQGGHQYFWSNCDPEGGTIYNIHAIPESGIVEGWIRGLEVGDEVTIVGYEVDRVDYDDGRWWTDAGCNTLIVTWICDGVL